MSAHATHVDAPSTTSLTVSAHPGAFAQLRNEFAALLDDRYQNEWHIGQVLCAMRDAGDAEGTFGGLPTLEAYVETVHHFSYRTAQQLMLNFEYLSAGGVSAQTAGAVGSWTKLAVIVRHKPNDLAHWLQQAKDLTRRELETALAALKPSIHEADDHEETETDEEIDDAPALDHPATSTPGEPFYTVTTACGMPLSPITGLFARFIKVSSDLSVAKKGLEEFEKACGDGDIVERQAAIKAVSLTAKAISAFAKAYPDTKIEDHVEHEDAS